VTHFVAISQDVTERKQSEAALRSSEERYRTLFDRNLAGVYRTTLDGRILECNDAFAHIFGHASREDALNGDTYALYPTAADREIFVERLQKEGVLINHEFVGRRTDGRVAWLLENAHLVKGDEPGAPEIIEGTLLDITERKRAEEALVASLREKEALLKEVHHRVKNNLQVITSLLRLESNRIDHTITRDVLRGMQNRIQSMATLHEILYRSGNFAQVDLAAYLRQLTSQLTRSLVTSPGQVELRLDLFSVGLDLDQAIPCGLIVNELVSNAVKHAFPAGRSGEVWVELQTVGERDLRLRVRDTGLGLPSDFEARRDKSLGLQLVSDLARQLGGRLEIGRGPGTPFAVTFTPSRDAHGEAPNGR
jgi:PAS domain S-box-containing protein